MAIKGRVQMLRGMKADFDPSKLLPGEWAVSIDADTNNRIVWMCFAPGFVKRMGTYEDFKHMIDDATGEIKEEYISEFNAIVAVAEEYANMTKENKDIVVEYVKTSRALMEMSEDYADIATSYAVGTNNVIRAGDSTDNAKYYKEQSENMYKCTYFGVCNSESNSRRKEITIDNLPEDLKIGQVVRVLFTNGNTYFDKKVPLLLIINGKYVYELYHFGNFTNAKTGMTYEFVKTSTSSLSLLNTTPISKNLTTTEEGFALDATRGKELDDKISSTDTKIDELKTLINSNVATLTKRCTDIEVKNNEQDTGINDVEKDISRVKMYLCDEWDTSSLPSGTTISYYSLGMPGNEGITAKDGEYCLDVTTGSVYYFSGYNNTWSKRYQLHKIVTPDDISSIKEKNAEQDESIGTLQEQLDTIPDTYATKKEVDSLEIGGRNLIAGTAKPTTVTAGTEVFKFVIFSFTEGALKVGQSYTVSADIEVLAGTVAAVSVGVYDDSSVEWISAAAEIVDGHIHATFKPKTPNKTKLLIYAGISGATAGNSIRISKLKFEKGEKATDWTPAPEDVDSRLVACEDNAFMPRDEVIQMDELDTFKNRPSGTYVVIEGAYQSQLTVFKNRNSSASALEIYHNYWLGTVKIRSTIDNNRYSEWKEISFNGHTHDYLPLTGGEVTGATKIDGITSRKVYVANTNGYPTYILMFDVTTWYNSTTTGQAKSGFTGHVITNRTDGHMRDRIAKVYMGVSYQKSTTENANNLLLRSDDANYIPLIIYDSTNKKYYLSLKVRNVGGNLYFHGAFAGTYVGTIIQSTDLSGTLPSGYEVALTGHRMLSVNRATADSDGNTINATYIKKSNVANNLTTTSSGMVLDATQGKILNDKIDELIQIKQVTLSGTISTAYGAYDGSVTVPTIPGYTPISVIDATTTSTPSGKASVSAYSLQGAINKLTCRVGSSSGSTSIPFSVTFSVLYMKYTK